MGSGPVAKTACAANRQMWQGPAEVCLQTRQNAGQARLWNLRAMDLSPSLPEMLICSADARRQVVARDGGNERGPAISPVIRRLDPREKRRYRRLALSERIISPRLMLQRI